MIDDQLVSELVDGHDLAVECVVPGIWLFAAAEKKSEHEGHEVKTKVTEIDSLTNKHSPRKFQFSLGFLRVLRTTFVTFVFALRLQ
jgi:hypothetical protein